jgi:hypothetical protein
LAYLKRRVIRRRDKELLSGRDSEVVLILTELMGFGIEVFNKEVKKISVG